MSKAITVEHFRRIASRRASLVAGIPSATYHRWKHDNGDGDITLTQAANLAQAKGLLLVFVRTGTDMANVVAPAAVTDAAVPTPAVPEPPTPPACACVRQWLRAQAALHVPPKPKVRPKPILQRKRYADD